MSKYLGNYAEDSTHYFLWSSNAAIGSSVTRATDGTIEVWKEGDSTANSTVGLTDDEDEGETGIHRVSLVLTDAFYATGKDYTVVLRDAVIDGQTVQAVLAEFSIENRFDEVTLADSASHGGANAVLTLKQVVVNNPSGLGVDIDGSTTGISVGGAAGNGIQAIGSGGSFAGLLLSGGSAGLHTSGGIADIILGSSGTIQNIGGNDVIEVGCDKTMVGHNLDHLMKTAVSDPDNLGGDGGDEVANNTVLALLLASDGDADGYAYTTDSQEAISDKLGTPISLDSGTASLAGMLTKMADDNAGADFDAGSDSLQEIRDRGDAAWTTGSVSIFSSTVSGGQVDETAVVVYQHGAFKAPTGGALTWTITDDAGSAVDVSAKGLTFAAYVPGDSDDVLFTYSTGGSGLTITGDNNNIVNLSADDTNTKTARQLRYVIWNTTDDVVIARGPLTIAAEGDTVVP